MILRGRRPCIPVLDSEQHFQVKPYPPFTANPKNVNATTAPLYIKLQPLYLHIFIFICRFMDKRYEFSNERNHTLYSLTIKIPSYANNDGNEPELSLAKCLKSTFVEELSKEIILEPILFLFFF